MDGTVVTTSGEQVVTRIGFAERWLDRAKRQCAEGNLTRGALTLVLADAEVHHALQVAGAMGTRRAGRTVIPPLMLALVVASAGVLLLSRLWMAPVTVSADPAPPIVTLTSRVGTLLDLVQTVPQPASRIVLTAPAVKSATMPVRTVTRDVRHSSGASTVLPSLASPSTTAVVQLAPSPVPLQTVSVSPAATPAAREISTGDLIDLVLAAERTLRSDPAQP